MARPRLPQKKADITGAKLIHAGRFKDRKVSNRTRPVGVAYATMTTDQRQAWEEFTDELPWLNSSHRPLLRVACILRVRMDEPDVGVSQIQAYSSILSKLGATPVDETKVTHADGDDSDPSDEFFGRPN